MKHWSKTANAPTGRRQPMLLLAALLLFLAACSGGPGEKSTEEQDAGADVIADATDTATEDDGTEDDGGDDVDPRLLDPTKLSAGYGHTCMIRSDQTVTCWGLGWQPDVYEGEGDHDQADPPDGKFVDISAGRFHTCGIRPDLSVECWGIGSDPETVEEPEVDDYDQSIFPDGEFVEISAGGAATCGIKSDGTLICRGFFTSQTLGAGSFKDVSVGWAHVCGVLEDGSLKCFGAGDDATEKKDEVDFDQAVPPTGEFHSVSAGKFHSCALATSGEIECWGLGSKPEDEHDGGWDFDQALPPEDAFVDVSVGAYHSCGVVQGSREVKCWGLGSTREREWDQVDYDQAFSKLGEFDAVNAGPFSTCARTASGDIECWGWNGMGQSEPGSQFGADGCQRTDYADWGRFACSPFCQTGCRSGSNCVLGTTSGFEPATWCTDIGPQEEGEDCLGTRCQKGLSCNADLDAQVGYCRTVCRRSQGHDDCPADYRCYTDAGRTAGYCVPEAGD